MDLELSPEDEQLQDVVGRLLAERAGPARARAQREAGGDEDDALLTALDDELGWRELLAGTTPAALVQQCIVAEACGRHVAQLHVAAFATGAKILDGPVAVVDVWNRAVRWPRSLTNVVVEAEGFARPVSGAEITHVGWGDPWGRVLTGDPTVGGMPAAASRWYRIVLVAEGIGAAAAAIERTVAYLTERHQFGSPLASRQSLRHGLAELSSEMAAARLSTLEAAAHGAPPHLLGLAATLFAAAAGRLVPELQRFTGAIGLSDEYELHLLTGRVRSIAAEIGAPARVAISAHRDRQEARR